MTSRRELQVAVLLCLLGAGLVLFAAGRPWVQYTDLAPLTIDAVRTSVRGSHIVPGAQALGYVGLAGVVALAATRGVGRLLVGVLVLASGIGVVALVGHALADGILVRGLEAAGFSCVPSCHGFREARRTGSWAVAAALLGGVLLALSGLLVAVRGRRWASLSASYELPAAGAPKAPATDKGVWDALDRGEDPTT